MSKTVTATFKTRQAAEEALMRLETEGFTEDQIGLIVSDETRGKTFNIDRGTKTDEGAAAGATAGGIIGAVIGGVMAAGALAIPGLNVVVSGALISGLAGLGAGAATGGLVGGLIGMGIPEHEAKLYEDEIKNGSILLAVNAENSDQKDKAKEILNAVDAYNIAA
jgi:uncharacterized membrane protein